MQSFPLVAWTERRRMYRWPVIRGVVALVESLAIGLRRSRHRRQRAAAGEEQQISSKAWAGTVVVAFAFAIGLFFVVPVGLRA